jgi:hypothetical protein
MFGDDLLGWTAGDFVPDWKVRWDSPPLGMEADVSDQD